MDYENNGGNFSDSVDAILVSAVDFDCDSSSPPPLWDMSGHDNGDDLNMHPGIDNLLEELTNQTRATDTMDEELSRFLSVIGDAEYGSINFETNQSQTLEEYLQNNGVFDVFEGAPRGTPPAARFVVEGLPEVEMKGGTDRVCVICSEEVAEGKKVKMLPCWHYYHGECIMPWLKMKNTCPVCRFELPTDNEIEGYLRRKRRRVDADNGSDASPSKEFSLRHSFELSLMLDYEDWKLKH